MSSNIQVKRICEYCGKVFIAKTTTTRYCSNKCNSASYKAIKRKHRVLEINEKVEKTIKTKLLEKEINTKDNDILTISEAAAFLRVCRRTIYNWLDNNTIKGKRISNRKILISKSDLVAIFEQNEAYEKPTPTVRQPITEFYTIKEIKETFKISERSAYNIIKENNMPKTRIGGKTHISKKHVDNYFKKKRDDVANITEWYTIKEIQEKYNLTRDQIYWRVQDNQIPKQRTGKFVKVSKQHFDELFIIKR